MVKKSSINPTIIEGIAQYKQKLAQHHIDVDRIFLFGSYAKGKEHRWSDIDLAVVSKQFAKDPVGARMKLQRLTPDLKGDLFIEPHPITPEELASPYYILSKEIRETGIEV